MTYSQIHYQKMNNFCNGTEACKILNCSDRTLIRYRNQAKLIEGIHWGRNPGGRVLYNSELLLNLVICGGDANHPDHQKVITKYLESLPENLAKKPGRKRATNLGAVAG